MTWQKVSRSLPNPGFKATRARCSIRKQRQFIVVKLFIFRENFKNERNHLEKWSCTNVVFMLVTSKDQVDPIKTRAASKKKVKVSNACKEHRERYCFCKGQQADVIHTLMWDKMLNDNRTFDI